MGRPCRICSRRKEDVRVRDFGKYVLDLCDECFVELDAIVQRHRQALVSQTLHGRHARRGPVYGKGGWTRTVRDERDEAVEGKGDSADGDAR